uniref:Uncharacterized protein n=1 Tax=Arundo donax TaxID=35708 RepID=A0A0A8YYH6_ARUDO
MVGSTMLQRLLCSIGSGKEREYRLGG